MRVRPPCFIGSDNNLYFRDRTGEVHLVHGFHNFIPATFRSPSGSSGTYYVFGDYDFPAADTNLTQASPTQTYGDALEAHAKHAVIVAAAAGTASGGTGAVEIEVSGTSITDEGTRTALDTEVIVADITAMATDAKYKTTKKWLGTVTFTLQNAAGSTQTTFAADFNYGLAKYEDHGNLDFTITMVQAVGIAGATDTGFDLELIPHIATGWTYHATAFVPGNGAIAQFTTDYNTETKLFSGKQFNYKRTNLSQAIEGTGLEGFVVRVTTGANNAVRNMDVIVGVEF